MDGRIDAQELHVRILLGEIEVGFAFLRSAARLTNAAMRARTLRFARHAYDATTRLMASARLTAEERKRIDQSLQALRENISRIDNR